FVKSYKSVTYLIAHLCLEGVITRSGLIYSELSHPLLIMPIIHPGVDNKRHHQNTKHHAQRNGDRNMVEIDNQHLDTDKHQNYRQTIFEHRETFCYARQQEIHRTQAEDRKQV